MEKSEVAELVVYAQSIQGREATALQVEAWHTLLADVPAEYAIEKARAHFSRHARDLWPADILQASSDDYAPEDSWMGLNR